MAVLFGLAPPAGEGMVLEVHLDIQSTTPDVPSWQWVMTVWRTMLLGVSSPNSGKNHESVNEILTFDRLTESSVRLS
jgi:hypothetical protein